MFHAQEHSFVEEKLDERGVEVITLSARTTSSKGNGRVGAVPRSRSTHMRTPFVGGLSGWLEKHLGRGAAQFYLAGKVCYQFLRQEVRLVLPIMRAIRARNIDLVHANIGLRVGKPAIVAAWLTRTPCICHVQMLEELTPFDRAFARIVDCFVYISTAVAREYTRQGIDKTKGTIIYHAVDLEDYPDTSREDAAAQETHIAHEVRAEFGWTPEVPLVGVVGRLDWWKGHEYFVEAMAQVTEQVPDVKALIVGAPQDTSRNREYHRDLCSRTQSLGLEDTVRFTGFRSDVPRLMSAMDAVVLPSSNPEPFGLVVLEGMAAGKPVIATAAGGPLDIIEDGISGCLVPLKDAGAMAKAIVALVSDRDRARQIGQAARLRVEARFTIRQQVVAMQQMYDITLAQGCQTKLSTDWIAEHASEQGKRPCA
jgi:glycosyltransferase involved in cell wall biosynthesis